MKMRGRVLFKEKRQSPSTGQLWGLHLGERNPNGQRRPILKGQRSRWLAVERARTGLCVTSKAACISLQEGFQDMGYKLATRGTKHLKRVPTPNISACQLVCVVKYTAWSVTSHQNRTKKSQQTHLGHSRHPADQSPVSPTLISHCVCIQPE